MTKTLDCILYILAMIACLYVGYTYGYQDGRTDGRSEGHGAGMIAVMEQLERQGYAEYVDGEWRPVRTVTLEVK